MGYVIDIDFWMGRWQIGAVALPDCHLEVFTISDVPQIKEFRKQVASKKS